MANYLPPHYEFAGASECPKSERKQKRFVTIISAAVQFTVNNIATNLLYVHKCS